MRYNTKQEWTSALREHAKKLGEALKAMDNPESPEQVAKQIELSRATGQLVADWLNWRMSQPMTQEDAIRIVDRVTGLGGLIREGV